MIRGTRGSQAREALNPARKDVNACVNYEEQEESQ